MSTGTQTPRNGGGGRWRAAIAAWSPRAAWAAAAVAFVGLGGGFGYWFAEVSSVPVARGGAVVVAVPRVEGIDPLPGSVATLETTVPTAETMPPMLEILAPPPSGDAPRDRAAPQPWQRFAVAIPTGPEGPPMIAVVIDDMGVALTKSWQAIDLPAPLTLAYLPYAQDLTAQTEAARRAGHELIVHLPMEPDSGEEDPGPNALVTGIDDGDLLRLLDWNLGRFAQYVGVSNHMGSRFTANAEAMAVVLSEVKARGLLYLDSRTTADTVALRLARGAGIPAARRDVFIDNVADAEAIAAQLAALEDIALERGYAVGIGHPRAKTLEALAGWLPGLGDRGFALAPISAIVVRTQAAEQSAAQAPQKSVSGAD